MLFLAVVTVLSASTPAHAEEHEALNILTVGGAFSTHFLKDRGSQTEAEAPERENLGGVIISYERILYPEEWAIVFAKPFLFGSGRFDSPFELFGKRIFVLGEGLETFFAAGITFNVRLFDAEREEIEGKSNEASLGVAAATGLVYYLDETFLLELEITYDYIPDSDIVTHELTESLQIGYAF